MPMIYRLLAVLVALVLSASALAQDTGPGLGRAATPEEIARADLTVAAGKPLPPGSGSVADGEAVYRQHCLACHGEAGIGGPMERLTGGIGSLTSERPLKTVASYWPYAETVFDYIRRAMPTIAPESLSDDQVYAVTAYILSVDGIVGEDAVLDAESLPRVRMPNRDGFVVWEQP